jgi:hypothetical protein
MIETFSAIVIQVTEQIIFNEQKQTKDEHKIERTQRHSFYRNSTFSIKSLCSFLKIINMVDIDSKTNQSLDNIIHHIQILIDHDSTNGYHSMNSEYETTVDSMIKYIIDPVIFPFLKEIYPFKASWYVALMKFCQTMVKSKLETLQIDINKAHAVFQNIRLACTCIDCQNMSTFLKNSSRHEYEYRQYRQRAHIQSSLKNLNLPILCSEGKFIKNIKLYDNQKQYIELMQNLENLRH